MLLINFAHPLTDTHRAKIEELAGETIRGIREAPAQFDINGSFSGQARQLVASLSLSPEEWQTETLLLNLPSLSVIAGLVLAEIHGRCGYFPAIVRLRPVTGALTTTYEVAEILNLQAVRDGARTLRTGE